MKAAGSATGVCICCYGRLRNERGLIEAGPQQVCPPQGARLRHGARA